MTSSSCRYIGWGAGAASCRLGFWIDSLPRSRTGNLEKGFKRSNLSNLSMTFPMTWLMADALLMCVVESSSTLIEVISTSLKHGENSDKDDSLLNIYTLEKEESLILLDDDL
eukprot:scaffold2504_cov248-Chaetoceros_neogracile.AAC.8